VPRKGKVELDLFAPDEPPSALGSRPSADAPGSSESLARTPRARKTSNRSVAEGTRPPEAGTRPRAESTPTRIEIPAEEQIPGASPNSAVSVATLTQTTKDVLEGAFLPLWVRGEISDFKAHRNGHWYFCLRDASAQIRCVVWARDQRRIPAPPDEGMQVAALGQLTLYAARGDLQFSVKAMEAEGDGLWRKALELTRLRLEADGLLAAERKRPLPRFPRRVAVVTSPDGAAFHDVVAVARRRAPHVEIVLVPAKVQGEGAPEEIVAALERVGRWGEADVVIVGRGGGAREDLWAFNDERVARAVASCPVPTISAVGHETDITLCDLVADLRAPTPSAAAEAAVPTREELFAVLAAVRDALAGSASRRVAEAGDRLRHVHADLLTASRLVTERARARLTSASGRLDALSPLNTLARGYALATSPDGRALTRAKQFTVGTAFKLRLHDGVVEASTDSVAESPQSLPSAERRAPSATGGDE
jgi:exodeoxyribonuclease VII large subunit